MSSSAATSLSVTLAHAIAYLTRALIASYPASTILKLQFALEANLTAQYASTWTPSEPLRGSGRRCLTLSPTSAPPRALHAACLAVNVDWSEWIKLLGDIEFDMFIDPGCISVRFGNWGAGKVGKFFTVWSAAQDKAVAAKPKIPALNISDSRISPSKTLAQQLLEDDSQEENELFAMIADEVREPTWITPILTQFPAVPFHPSASDSDSSSPVSRSSSRASSSSGSAFSVFSSPESIDSNSSLASDDAKSKMSRRERARQAKVFIDTSKNEVTNYDGGKTTVLTGGVMLGASKTSSHHSRSSSATSSISSPSSNTSRHAHSSSSTNWRVSPRV
jgi:hypothetical protein